MDDLLNHFFQPLTSIETDPSQQGILNSLSTKRNLLIQGPPGTGKSQTLTAILINALENKKRTIVVCEKRTALEVLESSLIKNGLGDNCVLIKDIIKDRKAVVDSVRARIENNCAKLKKHGTPKYQHLTNETNTLKILIQSINNRHKMIGKEVFDEENWTDTVGKYLNRLKKIDYQELILLDRKEFLFVGKELSNIVSVLEKGESLYQKFQPLESNVFINTSVFNNVNLIELEENAQSDYKLFSKRLLEIISYEEILSIEYFNKYLHENESKRVQYQSLRSNLIAFNELDKLRETYYNEYFTLRNTELVNGLSEVAKRIDALKNIENEYLSVPDFYDIKKTNTGIYKFSSLFSSSKKELIEAQIKVQYTYQAILEYCATYRIGIPFEYSDDIKTIISACEIISQRLVQYGINIGSSINSEYLNFEFKISENHNFHSTSYYLICEKLGNLQQTLNFFKFNFDDIKAKLNNDLLLFDIGFPVKWNETQIADFEYFIDFFDQNRYDTLLEEHINHEWSQIDIFKNDLDLPSKELFKTNILNFKDDLNNTNWFASKFEFNGSFENLLFEFEKTLNRFRNYFSKENNDLEYEYLWFSYYNQQPEKFKLIINELKGRNNWIDQFVLFYLNTVLIRNSDNVLSMDDSEYKSLDGSLRRFKKEQIYFIQSVCNYNQLEKVREFKETHSAKSLSVDNLYSKKSGTKHKRLSLRQIVN
jgi:DNA polymerase III delta prime subunit